MAMHEYPGWPLERAFGGIGTAVAPGGRDESARWPTGKSAPCARAACGLLLDACRDPGSGQVFVFLVGGAGNGKSKLANDVIGGLEVGVTGDGSGFAQRAYAFGLASGKSLLVINDATIPPGDAGAGSAHLVAEANQAEASGANLLACVNRGVLIGELASGEGEGTIGWGIAKALFGTPAGELGCPGIADDQSRGNYRFLKVAREAGGPLAVHVVFMDNASLLEPWPQEREAEGGTLDPLAPVPLRQSIVGERLGKPLAASEFSGLLQSFATRFLEDCGEPDELDPVMANAQSLSSGPAAEGWCGVLRGAEVASGNHFTYRELWGAACFSLLGPCSPSMLGRLQEAIEAATATVRNAKGPPSLGAVEALANQRTHMLLFRGELGKASMSGAQVQRVSSPMLQAVSEADPLRGFGGASGTEYMVALGLLAMIEEQQAPVTALAREDEAVGAYWTPFDAWVEKCCAALLDPDGAAPDAAERKRVLDFYGRYMFRLIGLARGWPAHLPVIAAWQRAWNHAQDYGRVPDEIERALRGLLLPSPGEGIRASFPAFRSRVDVLPPGARAITVDVDAGRFRFKATPLGSAIELEVNDYETQPSRVVGGLLDFHLVRECLARRDGAGFTDSLLAVEPRAERIRSGLLARIMTAGPDQAMYRFTQA